MDEMLRTEREIPKTVIREQEKPHAEALRANAIIYDALIERRANWYEKYRPSLESVPEVTPKIASRYRRDTIRLVEAAKAPVEFLQDLEGKKYKTEESKKRTIARWKKKCDLATKVLQEKFAGEGVALSGGKAPAEEEAPEAAPPEIAPEPKRRGEAFMRPPVEAPEEIPPIEAPEKPRVDLARMWQGVRERFRFRVDLKIKERLAELRKPVSPEEVEALEKRKAEQAQARKEALGKVWKRMKGISVLPSAGAVKGWVDRIWDKVSISPALTKEEMEAGLEAQKVKFKMPEFGGVSLKEVWREADPKTRRAAVIVAGVAVTVGATVVYCKITGTSGQEIYQAVTSGISGASQAVKEMLAKAPTTRPFAEVSRPVVIPEAVEAVKEVVKEVVAKPGVVTKPEVVKEVVKEVARVPWNVGSWRQMIDQAVAAKAQAVQTASEQVRQTVQTGIEIAKGSHSWGAAETAAKQVIEASGVQSDPERLSILTDAINKAGGLSDLVQPRTKLMLKPETTADILAKAIEKVSQVIAHGGAEGLKVPADHEDLQALTRVVEFLKSFK